MVNIGECIKDELQRQERTVSWLARKLNCTRAAVYRIFAKNSIDTQQLVHISQILHYNFFQLLSEDTARTMCSNNDTDV
ncbi:MAG: XRE family transcriptional regulator [Prevotella sp.]|nr:XRE family transcriptional regulator [Prevotella sp.]